MSTPSCLHHEDENEDPYDTFLECNSLGLANLMNGNLPGAYRHLCMALEITRREQQIAVEEEAASSSPTVRADPRETSRNGGTLPEHPGTQPLTRLASWPLLSREEVVRTLSLTKTFDLRMDGLVMSADALVRRGDGGIKLGRDDWTLVSAFVVYNIGLVYLIGGTQESNEAYYDKARIMFESSLALLLCSFRSDREDLNRESSASRKRLCPTGNPIVDVLSLMVLTKMSQTYHFLSRFDGTQAYVRYLGDFMHLLRNSQIYSGDDLVGGLIESHCERFAYELKAILELEAVAPAA